MNVQVQIEGESFPDSAAEVRGVRGRAHPSILCPHAHPIVPHELICGSAPANFYVCRRQPAEPEPVRGLSVAVLGLDGGSTVKNKLVDPLVAAMESLDNLD